MEGARAFRTGSLARSFDDESATTLHCPCCHVGNLPSGSERKRRDGRLYTTCRVLRNMGETAVAPLPLHPRYRASVNCIAAANISRSALKGILPLWLRMLFWLLLACWAAAIQDVSKCASRHHVRAVALLAIGNRVLCAEWRCGRTCSCSAPSPLERRFGALRLRGRHKELARGTLDA